MKSNRKSSRLAAPLCMVLVCLLSLASVSPQIHAWVFHGGNCIADAHTKTHSICGGLPHASEEPASQPADAPDKEDAFCPVVLFGEGVTLTDSSVVQLPERLAVVASIEAKPDTVWTSCFKSNVQARAPPVG